MTPKIINCYCRWVSNKLWAPRRPLRGYLKNRITSDGHIMEVYGTDSSCVDLVSDIEKLSSSDKGLVDGKSEVFIKLMIAIV